MNHQLRPFEPADLEPLKDLIHHTIEVSYADAYPEEAIRFFQDYHSAEHILKDTVEGHTLVLEIDGEIRGTGTLVEDEAKRVFVEPALQGQGLGKTIMAWIEEEARADGVETIRLDASLVARPFYDGLGYCATRECSIPVADGQQLDYWEMEKHL